jgi:branched-chain amino acid transport system ATP-binding protein
VPPVLEVRELEVYHGEARAIEGVSLDVADGEIVCIVGPNGAGKSTLVNTIAGLHRARSGRIVMAGADVTRVPAHRVCRHGLAIVPEGRRIFPEMTVAENLALGAYRPEARRERFEKLAWVHELFPRLGERAGQRAGSLSGGEQQMLAIGRALMAAPRLLLLDEPSLGLAPVIVDEVFGVIGTIHRAGVSVLLVEQNVQRALQIASRGYLLSEGRIVLEGRSAELLADGQVRRSVLGV